jgi:PPOX class probable F420-dependent enzyme
VDAERAREYVRSHHRAVLATFRRDGSIQMSPVLAGVDDDGYVEVSTSERAAKTKNVRRDPRATICVMPDRFYGEPYVVIEGRAEVASLPGALEQLVAYYRRISGEHPDWDDYRRAMRDEQRCLIKIDIRRAGPG